MLIWDLSREPGLELWGHTPDSPEAAADPGHFGCNVTETRQRHFYVLPFEEAAERFEYYQS